MRGATGRDGVHTDIGKEFQSTSLVRGATGYIIAATYEPIISIHVPRERGDSYWSFPAGTGAIFQSTSLVRGATLSFGLYLADF